MAFGSGFGPLHIIAICSSVRDDAVWHCSQVAKSDGCFRAKIFKPCFSLGWFRQLPLLLGEQQAHAELNHICEVEIAISVLVQHAAD